MNLDQVIQIVLLLLPLLPMPLIIASFKRLENRLVPASEQDRVKAIVRSVVMAVEQTCVMMAGPDKKGEAVRLISGLLAEHGLKVSPAMLDTLIEQAVYVVNQGQDPSHATQMSIPVVQPK